MPRLTKPEEGIPEFTVAPDIYFIVMTDNLISMTMYEISRKSWIQYFNGDATIFRHEATVPSTIDEGDAAIPLNFGRKGPMKEFTKWRDFSPGEMAAWYSHARLWQKVIKTNKPSIVLEHDCYLERPMNTSHLYSHEMVCFSTFYGGSDPDIRAGNGYYITPYAAKRLTQNRPEFINMQVDSWITKVCDNLGEYKYFARHIQHEDGANTCEHPCGKIEAEFLD